MNPRYFGSCFGSGTTRSGLWLLVFSVPLLTAPPSSALGEPLRNEVLEPRFDRYGDPLPPAASARLGTVRLRNRYDGWQVVISPDGKTLASGGADTTVLLWDVSPLRLALEELWTEERAGPADAVKLARKLAASQGEAVLFLEQYLQQLAARETSYEGLIVDLNSVRFEVRERAARKLEELGPDAESALRLALREAPSPQARLAIEGLLERPVERLRRLFADTESNDEKVWRKASRGVRLLRPEDEPVLRRLREESTEVRIRGRIDAVLNQPKALGEMPAPSRARSASLSVAILEEFATPEGWRVLRELALGPVKSLVTREAKTALERLENQNTKR